jgi:VWFA-related protein
MLRGICLLLALGGISQSPQDSLVIRTTTSLVEVRVVAETSHGKPVADLAESDFRILDNGQPQPIRLFAAYRGAATPANAGTGPRTRDSTPTPSDYALILLDWLNCGYRNRIRVKEQVLQLLKEYQPRQRLAIFVLSRDNPRLLADFTYDRDLLAVLVDRLSLDPEDMAGPVHGEGPGRGGRGLDGMAGLAHEEFIFRATNQLVDTARTFQRLADHLLRVPGRKSLLWVSSGMLMTIDRLYYAPLIEPTLARLNKADAAIYAIEANGFTPSPSDSLLEFARRTGGVAYYQNDDLAKSMRQALEDTSVSYTLGFHMPEDAKPGAHEIRIEVDRPKIKLRYRESYDPWGPSVNRNHGK